MVAAWASTRSQNFPSFWAARLYCTLEELVDVELIMFAGAVTVDVNAQRSTSRANGPRDTPLLFRGRPVALTSRTRCEGSYRRQTTPKRGDGLPVLVGLLAGHGPRAFRLGRCPTGMASAMLVSGG